ncbi:MAG: peroxiredoxin [Hyphomicrobium sp.]
MDNSPNLMAVDWTAIPPPHDDGAARHLAGQTLPSLALPATDRSNINLAELPGRTVVFVFPKTGKPGTPLPVGWDSIPGARGCTPQSCAFRDHFAELIGAGAAHVFGLSAQDTDYQREAAGRLHLPFALLSDTELKFTSALKLPIFVAEGRTLLKRITMVADRGRITKVFYPVFPPDQNARTVLNWLKDNPV